MSDFAITLKVQNGPLYKAIMGRHKNVAQFCKSSGLSQTAVGNLLNFKLSPLVSEGTEWSTLALRVADALQVEPEDVFPERLRIVLPTNKATRFVSTSAVEDLLVEGPERALETKQLAETIMTAAKLTPREKFVVLERIDGATLEEVGKVFDVNRERVRVVEARAFEKLRRAAFRLRSGGAPC